MFILGVGAAHPDIEITDEFLSSLGLTPTGEEAHLVTRCGVRSRRASLPLEYIQGTENREVLDGRSVAVATPTTLAVDASRQAMARAGITPGQIGLIIADTATPYQTCPSEAQRIGGALGIKIPAYDVVAGDASFPLYLEMLSSWKPERLPDYILCVSTNTLSQHVAYGGLALSAYVYGDAASAFVLSPRLPGKFKIVDSFLERYAQRSASSVVERHVACKAGAVLPKAEITEMLAYSLNRFASASRPVAVVGPQLYSGEFNDYEQTLGLSPGTMISGTRDVGYALGASCGVALSSLWDTAQAGSSIAVLHAGEGSRGGSTVVVS